MKFNKIVALALALVMVFALCACGGGNTDTKTDDTGSASKVDTNTVSVGAIVIARDDVPTDEIYAFVSTIFDNLDAITAQHAKGAELSIEAAASVKGVPYHPGAAKYFEEKGYKVDAVKEGAGNGTASALSFGTGGETRVEPEDVVEAGPHLGHEIRRHGRAGKGLLPDAAHGLGDEKTGVFHDLPVGGQDHFLEIAAA